MGVESNGSDERAPNTLLNALIGGGVSVLLVFFVPFSPIVGGVVAGYLEGGDTGSGAKVGTIAGIAAFVPLMIVVPFLIFLFFVDPFLGLGVVLLVAFVVGVLLVYTVGLSLLGGVVGVYVKNELYD